VLLLAPKPAPQIQFHEQLRRRECRTRCIVSDMGSRAAIVRVFSAPKYHFRSVF
jgi:hypothetical protein